MQIHDINLKAIPLSEVLIHEKTIPDRVNYLTEKIKIQGYLKNPVIVVKKGDKFIVIDGNHRIEALRSLSARTVIAQVFNYSEIRVEAWNRIIETDFSTLKKLLPVDKKYGRNECWIVYRGEKYGLNLDRISAIETIERLRKRLEIKYALDTSSSYPVFCYRPFSKKEILESALKMKPLPPKSTRHILPYRILGIRFPLKKLIEGDQEKSAGFLDELIKLRQREGSIREYPERILMLDEYE